MKNFKNNKNRFNKENNQVLSNSSANNLIIGRNAVGELIKNDPKRIIELLFNDRNNNTRDLIFDIYKNAGLSYPKVTYINEQILDELSMGSNHQGVIAKVTPRIALTINEVIKRSEQKDNSIVLVLDSIQDPQNFGSILRASECFGVDAVVYSKNRGVGVTATVSKVSAGASELVDILEVSNLANTIERFQKAGFWVVAADVNVGSKSIYEFEFPEKTVIIMGAEGKGVQPLLLKAADFRIFIPMLGSIDSLNVSQATAVMLSWYCAMERRAPARLLNAH